MANTKLDVLIFWQDDSIDENCLKNVERELKEAQGDKLYLVIHTNGGDPFSAVRIMRIIHEKYKEIIALVPSHAMSAGTLMALGANEIYMQHKSMLGPLDLPMEHPQDGSSISALDFKNTITTVSALSDSIAVERYGYIRKKFRIGKKEAAKLALDTATEFVRPIVDQVDPYHLQRAQRELKIGWFYAYDLLRARMMKDRAGRAWDTAKTLVNSFPSHDYGIFSDDATNMLNLTIKKLDDLPEWQSIKPVYDIIDSKGVDSIQRKEIEHASKTTTK